MRVVERAMAGVWIRRPLKSWLPVRLGVVARVWRELVLTHGAELSHFAQPQYDRKTGSSHVTIASLDQGGV
jgi:hypothetical protein